MRASPSLGAVRAALLLLIIALAGCTDPDPGPATSPVPEGSASTAPPQATEETVRPSLPPTEMHNQSYEFPGPLDPAIAAGMLVPTGWTRLVVRMTSTADCPVFAGTNQPQVVLTSPSGQDLVLEDFGGNGGFTFSGRCPTATTGQEELGTSEATAGAEPGEWVIRSQGSFTGTIRLAVVAIQR